MRKIIHIDMDCFYAAIEERDDPALRGKPVAVAGKDRRSVLTTANYEARKFGCRSAMPVFKALELCPHLTIVPVRFEAYRAESARIRAIFGRFTELIEPLSLDEAYLDVSHLQSGGAAIAREIRAQISEETGLTASAGISSNKLIAKIASDWNKPNGQFEVKPEDIPAFIAALPVGRLWGVGGKMRENSPPSACKPARISRNSIKSNSPAASASGASSSGSSAVASTSVRSLPTAPASRSAARRPFPKTSRSCPRSFRRCAA